MSNALAISGVTAVLQYYLNQLYMSSPFTAGTVTVSSVAPDLVQQSFETNASEPENQVNLFLHQVTHNASWRNVDLPSLAADGRTRLTSPPLALDLHYLLTVYATDPWQAEALLGYGLLLLHENPVLVRTDITTALQHLNTLYPTNALTTPLRSCGLADQVEIIKITPETLGREELAWLWTALKADYRPTFPFQASVVLMQPQQGTTLALPVLSRGVKVQPIQPAQILQVLPPTGQIAAAPTDTVTVTGENLSGVTQVSLTNARYGVQYTVAATAPTATSFTFVPNHTLAGVYDLEAQFTDASNTVVQTTNTLPVALAPVLPTQTATVAGNEVTVTFNPNAAEGQTVLLALGSSTAPALPFTGSAGSLGFVFPTLPASPALGRLQVDGVTSEVQVDWNAQPPVFTGPMVTL
jgi:Pvc16 N-terminal domain